MPLYHYRCDDCNESYEILHSILDDNPRTCEVCGKVMRRVIGAPGVTFKGSGFHKTDYAKKPSEIDVKPSSKSGESS